MHKRVLTAVLALICSLQLFAAPLLAQSPPFVFVDDPNSSISSTPYKIVDADGREYFAFQHTDGENLYFQGPSTSDCQYVIYGVSAASVPDQSVSGQLYDGQCSPRNGSGIDDFQALGSSTTITIEAGVTSGDPTGTEEDVPSCESATTNSLNWIACPLVTTGFEAVKGLADWIGTLLDVTPVSIGDTTDPVFIIWQNLRNIALVFLVLAFLIAIFGQALSLNVMDTYTVKRLIPRVGVAAIGIMLSYYISAIFVDIFNILGKGMYSLLLGATDEVVVQGLNGLETFGIVATTVAAAFTGGIIIALNPAILGLILLPVVMAFLSGLVVILLRQVIIVSLIIISPLAFAAWILPNTADWFKRWQKTFTVMLMMYPIIMILLASGSIFALTLVGGAAGDELPGADDVNIISYVLAILTLAITVGAIPFTLKFAGGVLSNIAGRFNDPNRGLADRARKGLQGRVDKRRQDRRDNRIAKYGDIKRQEAEGENKRPFKKGWLRATSGMYGYGRAEGKFGSAAYSEMIANARTTDQKTTIAQEKAKRETAQFADFGLQREMSQWESEEKLSREQVSDRLAQRAKDIGSIEGQAAGRAIITQRLEPELREVFDHVAKNGTASQKAALGQFKQENFGNIDSFAAHISRGEFADGGYKFAGNLLPGLDAESLKTQKGVEFAIGQAIAAGDEGKATIGGLMSLYSNTAPHQRTAGITKSLEQAAAGHYETKVPKLDASGNKQFKDGKLVTETIHASIPAGLQPDSAVVQKFEREVLGRGVGSFAPSEGSVDVSTPSELGQKIATSPVAGEATASQRISGLPSATLDSSSSIPAAPARPQPLTRTRVNTMTSGQIREYIDQQGGYSELSLSDLQLIAEGNPATQEVQQAVNTLQSRGVPARPTAGGGTARAGVSESRKQNIAPRADRIVTETLGATNVGSISDASQVYHNLETQLGGAPTTAEIAQSQNQAAPAPTRYDYVHQQVSNELGRRPTTQEIEEKWSDYSGGFIAGGGA